MAGKAAAAVLQPLPTPPTSQGSIRLPTYPTIYSLLAPRFPVRHLEAFGPSQVSWFVWQRFHSHGGYPIYSSRTRGLRNIAQKVGSPLSSAPHRLIKAESILEQGIVPNICFMQSSFRCQAFLGHLLPATSIFDPGMAYPACSLLILNANHLAASCSKVNKPSCSKMSIQRIRLRVSKHRILPSLRDSDHTNI